MAGENKAITEPGGHKDAVLPARPISATGSLHAMRGV
jgi:hypothetical protein